MAAPKKRDEEHKFLARIDLPVWNRLSLFAEKKEISANDALNEILAEGLKRKRLK